MQTVEDLAYPQADEQTPPPGAAVDSVSLPNITFLNMHLAINHFIKENAELAEQFRDELDFQLAQHKLKGCS